MKIPDDYMSEEELDEQEQQEQEAQEEEVPRRKRKVLPKMPRPPQRPAVKVPQQRYVSFAQQAAEGIADSESQEVIATDVWSALANIISRLERMENAIGVMQDG